MCNCGNIGCQYTLIQLNIFNIDFQYTYIYICQIVRFAVISDNQVLEKSRNTMQEKYPIRFVFPNFNN